MPSEIELREQRLISEGSPYALTEILVEGIPRRIFLHEPRGLNALYRKAHALGDVPLLCADSGVSTYREIFARAGVLAAGLRHNFDRLLGMRIGIALTSQCDWISAFVAVTSTGATAVLLDSNDVESMAHCVRVAQCKVILTDVAWALTAGESFGQVSVIEVQDLKDGNALPLPASWEQLPLESEALVAFTSGTTSRPKGVIQTHRGVVTGLMNMMLGRLLADWEGRPPARRAPIQDPTPRSLLLSPLCHIGGYSQFLLMAMLGGTLVSTSRSSGSELAEVIERQRVKSIAATSDVWLRDLMRTGAGFSGLSYIGVYGTALSQTIIEEIAQRWPHVTAGTGYGMTETAGSIAAIAGLTLRQRPTSSGRVLPSTEIRIVTPDGQPVGDDHVGEIQVLGANVMYGYCGETEADRVARQGWFRTGDLGSLGSDRCLYVTGRRDDIVTVRGEAISYGRIEQALIEAHGMIDAAIVPGVMADETTGLAIAVVAASADHRDAQQIQATLRSCFDLYSVNVVFVDQLPRNRSGKVDKSKLAAQMTASRSLGP
jgi:long-chain acyl-CoA synthetase